jgi:hypothetical protein
VCKMKSIKVEPGRGRKTGRGENKKPFSKLFTSILTSSRWVGSSSDDKAVLVAMLALMDLDGFVPASVPGIAKHAEVSIEAARTQIEKLKSPDPDSRSKAYEGRTIKEVDGGFIFLGHPGYRNTPTPTSLNGKDNDSNSKEENEKKRVEVDKSKSKNRVSDPNRVSYPGPRVNGDPRVNGPESQNIETFSATEQNAFLGLTAERQRSVFLWLRSWAERAAQAGEPDFAVARDFLAKAHECTGPNITDILRQFKDKDPSIIERTHEAVQRKGTEPGRSARYRWAIESTLAIPAMEEPEIEGIPVIEEEEEALEL